MSCPRMQRSVPCPGFNLDRSNTLTNEAAPPVLKVKSFPPPPPVRYYCLPSKHVGFSVSRACLFSVLVKALNNIRNDVIWCFDVAITIIIMRTGMPPFNNKHSMTGPQGNSEFCFPRISMFPETKSRETLRFEGNKIHCSPRDQLLSDLLYSKANGSNRWKTNHHVIDK